MSKSRFTPLALPEASHVADAVLAIDPLGNDNCPYCAHPNRRQLDVDLLMAEQIGPVVDTHQLAILPEGDPFGKEYAKICSAVEKHRRLHVIKVFESLDDMDAGVPIFNAPTLQFVDWTVRQYIDVYKISDEPKDQLASLGGLVKALQIRSAIRGEVVAGKTKPPDFIEGEIIISNATKKKMLEVEARKLGLKLVEPKVIELKPVEVKS